MAAARDSASSEEAFDGRATPHPPAALVYPPAMTALITITMAPRRRQCCQAGVRSMTRSALEVAPRVGPLPTPWPRCHQMR